MVGRECPAINPLINYELRITNSKVNLQPAIRNRTTWAVPLSYNGVALFNIILLGAIILTLLGYIVVSNSIVAASYQTKLAYDKLASLEDTHGSLTAQKLSMEDAKVVRDFAVKAGMVEAKSVSYLFENGNVALQK